MKLELHGRLPHKLSLRWGKTFNASSGNMIGHLLKTEIKTFVKFQVRGTFLESLARLIWDLINPPSSDIIISRQDDIYMTQIISRVLAKDSNCIDVGCYDGEFLSLMLRLAPLGYHHAFEPIPRLAKRIKQKFSGIDIRQIALSDSEQEVDFHSVISKSAYSGLQKRTYPDPMEVVEVIKVPPQKLDDLLTPDLRIHLIKVDVEGSELLAFKGAIRTLKTYNSYVLFEHGRGAADHYATTPEMIYELLVNECNLKLFRLKDWLENLSPLSLQDFICIYEHGSIWNFLATP